MITRQIGKILRGKATPLQVMMAAVLGSMLGFVPGFAYGPGLVVALVLALIVLNANLGVAAMVGLLAKLASFTLLPISFHTGRILLDGPASGVFQRIINAPVLALFGFEYYATTGGIVIGMLFGVVSGCIIVRIISRFRRKMAVLEEGSERYQKYVSKGWVKVLTWIFVGGGKGKKTYAELLEKRMGNPIRLLGVVFAMLVIGLLFIAQMYLAGPILTMTLRDSLEKANGATVEVGNAEVDLQAGKMYVDNLAMADPNALETDLLRAVKIEADISSTDLLRKRVRFDRIIVRDAVSGVKRLTPGRLIGLPSAPSSTGGGLPGETLPGEKTLEDYIAKAKDWKQRLAQAREWLEKVSGPDADSSSPSSPRAETVKDRIKRQILQSGYASVQAAHLIEGSPTLVITELIADGVKCEKLPDEILDIRGENLSTHPQLLAASPKISVESRSERIVFKIQMPTPNASAASTDKENDFRLTYLTLPVDAISQSLKVDNGTSPIQGGTMDVDLRGDWSTAGFGHIDLPLNITLRGTTISIPQAGSQKVDEMKLSMGIRGPMDNPKIAIDPTMLADALSAAGATALASKVRGEADQAVNKAKDKLTGEIGVQLDKGIGNKAKNALGGLLPGKKTK